MGCVASSCREDASIEHDIKKARREAKRELKLLLLGPGESGKSTILKQARIIHGEGYTTKQFIDFAPVIYSNIVTAMQTLVSQMDEFGVKPEDFIKESCELVLGYTPSSIMGFPTELAEALKILWNSSSIQECYRKRSRFHFNDSTKYYFEHLDRISSPEYIPSTVDILHSRVPTTGIVEYKFSIDDLHLRLLDVGGQRAERRKWIHCFTGITMIIFMASLNEYDQVLFEDSTQSRMRESIALFACIVNYEWFWETSFILFLNKMDLFDEKLSTTPFGEFFPEYKGDPKNSEEVKWYVMKMFFALSKNQEKTIYSHFTCATDTEYMENIFQAVRDSILQINLRNYNLI